MTHSPMTAHTSTALPPMARLRNLGKADQAVIISFRRWAASGENPLEVMDCAKEIMTEAGDGFPLPILQQEAWCNALIPLLATLADPEGPCLALRAAQCQKLSMDELTLLRILAAVQQNDFVSASGLLPALVAERQRAKALAAAFTLASETSAMGLGYLYGEPARMQALSCA